MPPTLSSLVHHSALKLTVRAGEDRLDVPVRWAHASELTDPVPYMEGGELLLITALKLDAENPESMRRYVRRLVGAGVVGLGFAVGVNYEDIPEALVEAATEEDLPLLEVPRRTPFLAISKAVSAAIAADQYRAVTAGFAAQRELTKHALTDGPEGLLSALASQVDGWAALYDASGAVVATAPEWAGRRAARLTADVERLRERPAPASSVVGGPENEDRVELHSLGTGRRPRAALAVGTATALGTAERYAVHSAIALLTLTTERSRSLQAAEQRIGAAVLRMLLAGQPDHARAVAGGLYGGLLDAPFRMIVAESASVSAARVVDSGSRVPLTKASAAVLVAATEANGDPLGALTEIVESAATAPGRRCWWCRRGRARARGWWCSRRTAVRRSRRARSTRRRWRRRAWGPCRSSPGSSTTSWSSACRRRPGPSPRRRRTSRPSRHCRWPGGADGCSWSMSSWLRGPCCRCSRTTR